MIRPGLVSVTCRELPVAQVVSLAREAGLHAIEWGGDVHVPHGDLASARRARDLTIEAGLQVAAYGSYYRAGMPDGPEFEAVLDTAVTLGAPAIRVWAGAVGSDEADPGTRGRVVDDSARVAALADAAGLSVAFEYHGGSLTDTAESTRALLDAVPAAWTLWQPPVGADVDDCERQLGVVLDRVRNVHVFHWWPTSADRHPLADGADSWARYLSVLSSSGREHLALLEFVRDGDPQAVRDDAATLRRLLGQVGEA